MIPVHNGPDNANGDSKCAKFEDAWKWARNILAMIIPEVMLIVMFKPTFVPNLMTLISNKNQSMDAKREWAIKFSVIHIFKAAESL